MLSWAVWATYLHWWDREDRLLSQAALIVDWLQSSHGRSVDLRDYWMDIVLVCRCLWRHQNDIVFEGATPSSLAIIRKIRTKDKLWSVAGLFRARLTLVDRWRFGE
jgi:hypothetical protein